MVRRVWQRQGRNLKARQQPSIQGLTTGRCYWGVVTHWRCLLPRGLKQRRVHVCLKLLTIFFCGDLHSDLLGSITRDFNHCKQADTYVKLQVPDNRVPLSVGDVGIVCEQDSVVGHHRLARGKNATWNVAHTVQNAVIHQEVIYQQLMRQRMSAEGNKLESCCASHSQQTCLRQIPLLLAVESLNSSTAWSWTRSSADRKWHRRGWPRHNYLQISTVHESPSERSNGPLKRLPVQAEPGPATYASHHECCWLHLLIYLEFSRRRSRCPARSRCLETPLCLEVTMLRTFIPFNIQQWK